MRSKIKSISIIDSYRYNEEHAPFNSAFIYVVKKTFSESELFIYCQEGHRNKLLDIFILNGININGLNFISIKGVSNKKSSLYLLMSYLISSFFDLVLLFTKKSDLIFFTTCNPLSIFFVKLMNLILRKNIYIVLHGELEYINKNNENNLNITTLLLRKWYRFFFLKLMCVKTKYIVLGESILLNLKSILGVKMPVSSFICIDHPYFFKKINKNKIKKDIISCGIIGHAAVAKGANNIYVLAQKKENEIENMMIEFKIIGHISSCMNNYMNNLVIINSNKEFMPRIKYENEVSNLDYILFFYPESMYNLIASGAFFDALYFEKPILALRNSFFEYYFDLFGDIGCLFNNIDEMSIYLSNHNLHLYNNQVINIKKAKIELSLDSISKKLFNQI